MKKKFVPLFVILLLLLFTLTANAQITQQLNYGTTNTQVSELQTSLKNLGFFNSSVTGSYDYNTYLGVKNFQTKYALNPTGNLDLVRLAN